MGKNLRIINSINENPLVFFVVLKEEFGEIKAPKTV